ncbi:MAG TPA: hypothetical protein VFE47_02595 [Tepidisphaeraceae bacterium]|jgi:hypothetical protein|nr:hypothetical protein [Tepidisphaeraceae bacterium]
MAITALFLADKVWLGAYGAPIASWLSLTLAAHAEVSEYDFQSSETRSSDSTGGLLIAGFSQQREYIVEEMSLLG